MTPISNTLVGIGIVFSLLVGFSAFCAFRSIRSQIAGLGSGRMALGLATAGIGTLAFGFRLSLAEGNVSWCPYLDQWHAEISGLVGPLAHGNLAFGDLIAGNNEHRVFLTRALALAVTILNGGWDNRVMVMATYFMESFMVAWVCALAWSYLGWLRGGFVAAAVLLPMVLVCGWETIVSSNQTQFVFMTFGTVVALSLAQDYSFRSLGTWGALVVAILTLGSMASGFLTVLAMLATGIVVAFVRGQTVRSVAPFGVACLVVAALGWFTRVEFTALFSVYARSFPDWLNAFLVYAAWPLPPSYLGFACMWLPWSVLLYRTLWFRRMEPFTPFAFGIGLWVLLQAGALAWARSGLSGLVGSRYTEFLSWGFVANAAAAALLLGAATHSRRGRLLVSVSMLVWLSAVAGYEIRRSRMDYLPYMEGFHVQTLEHEQRLGTFMRTGDAGVIEGVAFPHIPYIFPAEIVSPLRDPQIQVYLPAPLRRDLVRDRQPSLLPSVQDGPLSFVSIRALRLGPWVALAGAALLLFGLFRASRSGGGGIQER